jgi:hypothetical protein
MDYLNAHVEKLKEVAVKQGPMHLGNILESNLKLTEEYRALLGEIVFEMKPIDIMLGILDIPSREDLCRAEMIIEAVVEPGEYLTID